MTFNQLLQTLRLAMQDKQPQLYKQMEAAGTLDEFLQSLAATADSQISEAWQQIPNLFSTTTSPEYEPDPIACVQKAQMKIKQAEEIALQQAIEQIEAMTTESSPAS